MKKIYIYSAALAATFGLSACDSSSAAAAPSENQNTIKSVDDLTNCTEKKAGQLEVVQADVATDYICADINGKYQWVALSETKGYADDFKVCNDAREGLFALAKDELALFICTDNSWDKAAKFETIGTKEAESDDDDVTSSDSKKSNVIDDDDDEEEDEDIKSSSSKKQTFIDDDDEEEEDDVKSSSSKNTETGEKAVKLINGIIWQPSYGRRAWTGAEGVDEYNFWSDDEGGAGWWFKYLDDAVDGSSNAAGKFNEDDLTLNYSLSYFGWHYEEWTDGLYSGTYPAPDVYPYAGFAFGLVANSGYTDITSLWESGLCVVYSAAKSINLIIGSKLTNVSGTHFSYTLSASTSARTVNISWSYFEQPDWAIEKGYSTSKSAALAKADNVIFQYEHSNTGLDGSTACSGDGTTSSCQSLAEANNTNTVKIYKIGTYGNCGGSNSYIDDPYL